MALINNAVSYSISNIALTIDGSALPAGQISSNVPNSTDMTAFGEDGGINLTPMDDIMSLSVGASGHVVVSVNANHVLEGTITIHQNSKTLAVISAQAKAQHEAMKKLGQAFPIPFGLNDPASGTSVAGQLFYQSPPDIDLQDEAGDREVNFWVIGGRDKATHAGKRLNAAP